MRYFKDILEIDTIIQRSDEWFTIRENMLTASDVASSIGKNPYKSRKQLLSSKVNPSRVRFESDATRHGTFYESVAIQKFCEKTGHVVHDVGIFVHPEHKWLGGSPDGLTETCQLIEVKCPLKRKIEHKIPDYYYPQVQVCMEILDINSSFFIQYRPQSENEDEILDILEIHRDKQWFNDNLPLMHSFWKDVQMYRDNPTMNMTLYGVDPKKVLQLKDIYIDHYAFIDDNDEDNVEDT
jgi:putative phage-type endonuclease